MSRFNSYLLTEGKNEKYFETASCCGIFLNEREYIQLKSGSPESTDILNSVIQREGSRDWSNKNLSGYDKVKGITIRKLSNQAMGMYDFIHSSSFPLNKNNIDFIHGSISDYYTKERKLFSLEKGKANTTDLVICEGKYQNILNIKEIENINIGENGLIDINGIKFIQISLKAGKATKLGNVKNLLKSKGMTVNEGFIKDIFNSLKTFLNKISSKFRKIFKKYDDIKVSKYINEDVKSPEMLHKEIIKKYRELNSKIKLNEFPIVFEDLKKKPNNSFKLGCNLIALNLAEDLRKNIVEKNGDVLKDLIMDGYFGTTELPIFIVYGYPNGHEFIGTKRENRRKMNFNSALCAMRMKPSQKDPSYFVVDFWILEKIDDDGNKIYINLGTMPKPKNQFAIEFRSRIKKISLDKSIGEVI